ncbi:diguanylate cyclase [Nitrospirota bacterium]
MRDRANAIFRMVLLSRLWNASHGGVYVPVTESVSPNPYLEDPLRDLSTDQGILLTKVNPAFMTRQMSELISFREGMVFHITSLKPIRSKNSADKWETAALKEFEAGKDEKFELQDISGMKAYRYMAPLFVEKACLKCHAKQGYNEGDIRGGISVIFPAQKTLSARATGRNNMIWLHTGIFFAGLFSIIAIFRFSRKADNALLMLSIQDGLTGIANRRHFNNVLEKEWLRARRNSSVLSIIMADIDFFKQFNDIYGHQTGDDCIVMVTDTLSTQLKRPGDFLARYGGEEFVAMLPGTDFKSAISIAESMRQGIEAEGFPHKGSDISPNVTISAGVASIVPDVGSSTTASSFVSKADRALYKAKHNGRNRVEGEELPDNS